MSIALKDLPAAVETYLETLVTCTVSPIVPDVPNTMTINERGSFSTTVTNAPAPDGVRLTNIKHHLSIEPINRGMLVVPATPVARATTDPTDPPLAPGTLVDNMFLFPTDATLDVGDSDTIANLRVQALALGSVTISNHVHASLGFADVFPVKNSRAGEESFTVV